MYRKLDVDADRGAEESDGMLAQWPAGERPRERLYWNGPGALADSELLALQLGTGTRGRSAIDVAREVLATYGSLAEIASREVTELAGVAGIGPVKAARLAATFALTRRRRPLHQLRATRPSLTPNRIWRADEARGRRELALGELLDVLAGQGLQPRHERLDLSLGGMVGEDELLRPRAVDDVGDPVVEIG